MKMLSCAALTRNARALARCPPLPASPPGFGRLVARHREERGRPPEFGHARPSSPHLEHERRPHRVALAAVGGSPGDPLDPMVRQAAQLAPPPHADPLAAAARETPTEARARASLEDLLPALVRKVGWSGDGRRGTVRLELGSGSMAGAQVIVESDHGRVRVHLRAPDGVDAEAWRRRIAARLGARGLDVDEVEVE